MSNIQKTKHNLTLTFTIVVFIVIMIFGGVFFSTKYFRSVSVEKKNFSSIVQLINKQQLPLNTLIDFQNWVRENFRRWNKPRPKLQNELLGRGQVNFILLDSTNTVVSHNVKVEVWDDFLEELLEAKNWYKIHSDNKFLFSKFSFKQDYSLIVFQKNKYPLWDYISDIVLFLLLSSLLSGLIYVTWRKFVNKTFIPVEANIEDMKNFVHNAGHELKTPLSVIDSNLQIAQDVKKYDKEMIGENRAEIKKLNSLLDSLIQLSDIDSLKSKQKVHLKTLIEEVIEDHKEKASEKKIDITTDISNEITVESHRDYLYILVSNIIGNAIKYNKKKWQIDITYHKWILSIKDNWAWIKKSDIKKIWKRFYQSDSSRWWEWFGIWLSLVKKIADIYKWKISLKSEEKKGSTFTIKF